MGLRSAWWWGTTRYGASQARAGAPLSRPSGFHAETAACSVETAGAPPEDAVTAASSVRGAATSPTLNMRQDVGLTTPASSTRTCHTDASSSARCSDKQQLLGSTAATASTGDTLQSSTACHSVTDIAAPISRQASAAHSIAASSLQDAGAWPWSVGPQIGDQQVLQAIKTLVQLGRTAYQSADGVQQRAKQLAQLQPALTRAWQMVEQQLPSSSSGVLAKQSSNLLHALGSLRAQRVLPTNLLQRVQAQVQPLVGLVLNQSPGPNVAVLSRTMLALLQLEVPISCAAHQQLIAACQQGVQQLLEQLQATTKTPSTAAAAAVGAGKSAPEAALTPPIPMLSEAQLTQAEQDIHCMLSHVARSQAADEKLTTQLMAAAAALLQLRPSSPASSKTTQPTYFAASVLRSMAKLKWCAPHMLAALAARAADDVPHMASRAIPVLQEAAQECIKMLGPARISNGSPAEETARAQLHRVLAATAAAQKSGLLTGVSVQEWQDAWPNDVQHNGAYLSDAVCDVLAVLEAKDCRAGRLRTAMQGLQELMTMGPLPAEHATRLLSALDAAVYGQHGYQNWEVQDVAHQLLRTLRNHVLVHLQQYTATDTASLLQEAVAYKTGDGMYMHQLLQRTIQHVPRLQPDQLLALVKALSDQKVQGRQQMYDALCHRVLVTEAPQASAGHSMDDLQQRREAQLPNGAGAAACAPQVSASSTADALDSVGTACTPGSSSRNGVVALHQAGAQEALGCTAAGPVDESMQQLQGQAEQPQLAVTHCTTASAGQQQIVAGSGSMKCNAAGTSGSPGTCNDSTQCDSAGSLGSFSTCTDSGINSDGMPGSSQWNPACQLAWREGCEAQRIFVPDGRCSLVVLGIPNHMPLDAFKGLLDQGPGVAGQYSFLHMPRKHGKNKYNPDTGKVMYKGGTGVAFLHMADTDAVAAAVQHLHGLEVAYGHLSRRLHVAYAEKQGIPALAAAARSGKGSRRGLPRPLYLRLQPKQSSSASSMQDCGSAAESALLADECSLLGRVQLSTAQPERPLPEEDALSDVSNSIAAAVYRAHADMAERHKQWQWEGPQSSSPFNITSVRPAEGYRQHLQLTHLVQAANTFAADNYLHAAFFLHLRNQLHAVLQHSAQHEAQHGDSSKSTSLGAVDAQDAGVWRAGLSAADPPVCTTACAAGQELTAQQRAEPVPQHRPNPIAQQRDEPVGLQQHSAQGVPPGLVLEGLAALSTFLVKHQQSMWQRQQLQQRPAPVWVQSPQHPLYPQQGMALMGLPTHSSTGEGAAAAGQGALLGRDFLLAAFETAAKEVAAAASCLATGNIKASELHTLVGHTATSLTHLIHSCEGRTTAWAAQGIGRTGPMAATHQHRTRQQLPVRQNLSTELAGLGAVGLGTAAPYSLHAGLSVAAATGSPSVALSPAAAITAGSPALVTAAGIPSAKATGGSTAAPATSGPAAGLGNLDMNLEQLKEISRPLYEAALQLLSEGGLQRVGLTPGATNLLWALSKLSPLPPALLHQVCEQLLEKRLQLEAAAAAEASSSPAPTLPEAAGMRIAATHPSPRRARRHTGLLPHQLPQLLWALGRNAARIVWRTQEVTASLASQAQRQLHLLTGPQAVQVLWGLTCLKHADQQLLDSFVSHLSHSYDLKTADLCMLNSVLHVRQQLLNEHLLVQPAGIQGQQRHAKVVDTQDSLEDGMLQLHEKHVWEGHRGLAPGMTVFLQQLLQHATAVAGRTGHRSGTGHTCISHTSHTGHTDVAPVNVQHPTPGGSHAHAKLPLYGSKRDRLQQGPGEGSVTSELDDPGDMLPLLAQIGRVRDAAPVAVHVDQQASSHMLQQLCTSVQQTLQHLQGCAR